MNLTVEQRTVFGKKAKPLRAQGRIPAELYGNKVENRHLSVDAKEFLPIFKEAGESTIIHLRDKDQTYPVLIQEVDIHPVSDEVRNIDFYQVDMKKKLELSIPVEFMGEAPAVKQGGVLVKAVQDIEIRCLPADIPHTIRVDLSALKDIDQAIAIKDLAPINGVEILLDPGAVIAIINAPVEEPAEETPADVSTVVVEGEEKRKQEAAQQAEEGSAGEKK